jgi:endoglucanase
LKVRVVAVSTVQEEVGLRGAQMIARTLAPSVALVTDVGHATDSPGISHAQHGLFKLAAGPKIAVGGAMQPEVVARLAEVAAGLSIPLQRAATPGGSGTDTDAIFVQGGIPCGLVSLPIRYMHTTVEMTSLRDLNRIAHLFAGFALSMKPGEKFTGVL